MVNSMKLFAIALLFAGSITSCKKDKVVAEPNLTFAATLNGTSETPANLSTATGTSTATFNGTTKILTVVTTHTVVNPTDGHIHNGAVGVAGPVVFAFPSAVSPINYTSTTLTADQETALKANLYYVNIHSNLFPEGEIRGQLIKQ